MRAALLALLIVCTFVGTSYCGTKQVFTTVTGYTITVERINGDMPILDSQLKPSQSVFPYNYNTAYVPVYSGSQLTQRNLLVRCQYNTSSDYNPPSPYATSPSVLALTNYTTTSNLPPEYYTVNPITNQSVVFQPETWYETAGTEDPRVIYRASNQMYYLLYTAVQTVTQDNSINVRLSLATAKDPNIWTRQGPIFKDHNGTQWTKSGALLCRDGYPGPHYLFYGDSTEVKGLQVALTEDMINYVSEKGVWMPVRNSSFDSYLVEAGPEPLLLSDGNYLFIYNSARSGYPSSKPGYDLQYNVGWAILNGTYPTDIIERASEPLLSPLLPWEVGANALTPNVVFCEGWEQVDVNTFILYYGAADTAIGAALVTVEVPV